MKKIIIQACNPCAAVEFVFALNPFWLHDLDIHPRMRTFLFCDTWGDPIKTEIEIPDDVVLRYADRSSSFADFRDTNPKLCATISLKIGIFDDPVKIARRQYPHTGKMVYPESGQTHIVELELELDGIWTSWDDAQRPDCPSFDDEPTCTNAPQYVGQSHAPETMRLKVAQSMESPIKPRSNDDG